MPEFKKQNNTFDFDPDSASKWFQKLEPVDRKNYADFLHRLNYPTAHIPDEYKGAVKRMNQDFKINVDPSILTDEQTYEIDQYLVRTWFEQQPMAQLLAPIMTVQQNPRWTSKHYELVGGDYPEFTQGGPNAFRNVKSFKLGVEPKQNEGVGAAIKIDLSWAYLAQAMDGAYNPEIWHNRMMMKYFGVFWDQRLTLGTAGENTSGDLGIKGIHNYTSLPTEAFCAGTDNDFTAGFDDFDIAIAQGLGDLRNSKEPGMNVILSTSGVASELLLGESSYTDRTDYQRIKEKWFDSGIITQWIIDDNLEADANSNATGRFQLAKISPNIMKWEKIFPFQKKPNLNKEFADDVSYTYLTADLFKIYNVNGLTVCSTDCATTLAGFLPNGVFMEGAKRDHMQALDALQIKAY